MRRSTIILLAALSLSPAPARAEGAERHYFVGAKLAYLAALEDGHAHHHLGGGVFFEASLVPHRQKSGKTDTAKTGG